MAHGSLMRQAWQLVWANKFLIVIGAAPQVLALLSSFLAGATGGLASIVIVAAVMLAQACLVTAVLQLLDTGQSGYQQAWDAAWAKKWRIAGIELLAGIPASIIGGVIAMLMGIVWAGFIFLISARSNSGEAFLTLAIIEGVLFVLLIFASILIGVPARILGQGAVISCLTADTPIFDSLQRAWDILRANPGPAVILALLYLIISLVLGLLLLIPQVAFMLCPITWPVAFGISGAISAWGVALWTIAWRGWLSPATK